MLSQKKRFLTYLFSLLGGVFFGTVVSVYYLYDVSKALSVGSVQMIDTTVPWWSIQAIDTMKYSRDPSREFLSNPNKAQTLIEEQLSVISQTGATHVAIATPYDDEFAPVLSIWVTQARLRGLKVWFRGNWAGWEGWFEYPRISRAQHLEKTKAFILNHPDLFEDGDIFTACPECENGGPGDPRRTGDTAGFRQFLIDEHIMMEEVFSQIGKNVQFNLNSMNGDVAELIMDKPTTTALGGLVTVDHYVADPDGLAQDIVDLANKSGGKIVLGEFGAPIPDIHGNLTETQQAEWIQEALEKIAPLPELVGVNYWTAFGGSTALWNDNASAREAVTPLTQHFTPQIVSGVVVKPNGRPIQGAVVSSSWRHSTTGKDGTFVLPLFQKDEQLTVTHPHFHEMTVSSETILHTRTITLESSSPGWWTRFTTWFSQLFS